MDTSRSADSGPIAGIDVFSGRPNPTWPLPHEVLAKLMEVWNELRPASAGQAQAPILGYRGCFVQDGDARWTAFRNAVTLQGPQGAETRLDEPREFARLLLESAPADVPVDALVGLDRS